MLLLERPRDPRGGNGEHGDAPVGQCAEQLRKTQVVACHDAHNELAEGQHQELVAVDSAWHEGVRLLLAQGVVEVELAVPAQEPLRTDRYDRVVHLLFARHLLEHPGDGGHAEGRRGLRQGRGKRSVERLGGAGDLGSRPVERVHRSLGQDDELGTTFGGIPEEIECPRTIGGRVRPGCELGDSDPHEETSAMRGPTLLTCRRSSRPSICCTRPT
jgi:hypothetical protein